VLVAERTHKQHRHSTANLAKPTPTNTKIDTPAKKSCCPGTYAVDIFRSYCGIREFLQALLEDFGNTIDRCSASFSALFRIVVRRSDVGP
jgi:hypothetical protein